MYAIQSKANNAPKIGRDVKNDTIPKKPNSKIPNGHIHAGVGFLDFLNSFSFLINLLIRIGRLIAIPITSPNKTLINNNFNSSFIVIHRTSLQKKSIQNDNSVP